MNQTKNKMADNYKFSQDYELIPPQKQRSYPISTTEWTLIKKKISEVKDGANFWHTIGSILIGAAISTLITALINDFKTEKLLWTCWAAFFVTGISGSFAFYFGKEQRQTQNKSKEDVIDFMTIIEERFPNSLQASTPTTKQEIIINSAKYGAEGKFTDVTARISGFVEKNILEIKASNDLVDGQDPIVGKVKTLIIDYTINGENKNLSIMEGKTQKIE